MPPESTEPILSLGRKLSELKTPPEDDPDELLKYRFLCPEGVIVLNGPTGIGKSSLSMQFKIQLALGRDVFGFIPRRPLKSLLIQAENDDGDLAEMRDGVIAGYGLTPEEAKLACDNIIILQEDSLTGKEFFDTIVGPALAEHKPDLLWIDPALAYLGGDTLSQKDVTHFLRNLLKPLLKIHKCACVIVHHTNKTGKNDSAYSGSGSSEWGNMPRAVISLINKGNWIFELIVAKRDKKLRWKMPDGKTFRNSILLKHSHVENQIFWQVAGADDHTESLPPNNQLNYENEIFERVPESGTIPKNELVAKVNKETDLGQNKIKLIIKEMILKQTIYAEEHRRTCGPAEIHISRKLSKKETILRILEKEDPDIRNALG